MVEEDEGDWKGCGRFERGWYFVRGFSGGERVVGYWVVLLDL